MQIKFSVHIGNATVKVEIDGDNAVVMDLANGISSLIETGRFSLNQNERTIAANGSMIQAIKEHRARTGSGLKESKDAVDAYLASIGKPGPVAR